MTQSEALDILKTGANVFLTGEPGAGKTYTLNKYIDHLRDSKVEVAITASTGIAATHIGGMTIHSWSGIGIKKNLNKYDLDKITTSEYVSKRINRAKVLVIDEISMLSSDVLSMVDAVCRAVRQKPEAFGGLQVILVGDFFQLPPVVKREVEEFSQASLLDEEENSIFAYGSTAWDRAEFVTCYITEQYRQDDKAFLSILSAIRANNFDQEHLEQVEARILEISDIPKNTPKLYSHNLDVDKVNANTLSKLEEKERVFYMTSTGPDGLAKTLKKGCLSPEELVLKVGAEVMFTKNNPREKFVNGTLGVVTGFSDFSRQPIVETRDGNTIEVTPMDWSVEENGKIKAKISQVPLRLAWAITVHKSQGMSMDSAIVDLSQVFEYGQGYVALSRVRRFSGLYLLGVNQMAFQVHPEVLERDEIFKSESEDARELFGKLPAKKLKEMHENFILACGGSLKKIARKKIRENKFENSETEVERKGVNYDEIRKKYPNAYRPWSDGDDKKLTKLFRSQKPVKEIAEEFGRKRGAIRSRLRRLDLIK